MIQRSCIDYWLSIIIATEHYQQIANHSCFLVVVELYYLLVGKLIQSHLNHRYSALYYLFACSDDGTCLLATQHYSSNLRSVGQIVDTGLYHLDASKSQAFVEFLFELFVDLVGT